MGAGHWVYSEDEDLVSLGEFLLGLDDGRLATIIKAFPDPLDSVLLQLASIDPDLDDAEKLDLSDSEAISLFVSKQVAAEKKKERLRIEREQKKLDLIDRDLNRLTKTLSATPKPLSAQHLERMVEKDTPLDRSDIIPTLREWSRLGARIKSSSRSPVFSGREGFLVWIFSSRSDEECASILIELSRSKDVVDQEVLSGITLLVDSAIERLSYPIKAVPPAPQLINDRAGALSKLKPCLG